MKTTFNQETGIKTWGIDRWYEKAVYIMGWFFTILFLIGFVLGFVEAI